MLVLARKSGERVSCDLRPLIRKVLEDLGITIPKNLVKVSINGELVEQPWTAELQEKYSILISLLRCQHNKARLGFEGRKEITIVREELMVKEKV